MRIPGLAGAAGGETKASEAAIQYIRQVSHRQYFSINGTGCSLIPFEFVELMLGV